MLNEIQLLNGNLRIFVSNFLKISQNTAVAWFRDMDVTLNYDEARKCHGLLKNGSYNSSFFKKGYWEQQ